MPDLLPVGGMCTTALKTAGEVAVNVNPSRLSERRSVSSTRSPPSPVNVLTGLESLADWEDSVAMFCVGVVVFHSPGLRGSGSSCVCAA